MPRRTRTGATVAVAIAGLLAVAGCGSDSGGAAATTASTSAEQGGAAQAALAPLLPLPKRITVEEPLSRTPPRGKQVYFLSNGITAAQLVGRGVTAAAQSLGWSAKVLTIDQADPTSTNSAMLSAINAGADAIVVVTTPKAQFTEALNAARAKGVRVIDMGTDDSGDGLTPVAQSTSSGRLTGAAAGKLINADAARSGATVHVADVSAPVIAAILRPSDDALRDTVTQDCADCSYDRIDLSTRDFASGGGMDAVISFLQRNPDVDYLHFTAPAPQGWQAALAGAGLTKVKVSGGGSDYDQQQTQAGKMIGITAQSYEVMGWTLVDAAARAFVGDDTAPLAKRLAAPIWVLTPETRWTIASDIGQPPGYQQQYQKLWRVAS